MSIHFVTRRFFEVDARKALFPPCNVPHMRIFLPSLRPRLAAVCLCVCGYHTWSVRLFHYAKSHGRRRTERAYSERALLPSRIPAPSTFSPCRFIFIFISIPIQSCVHFAHTAYRLSANQTNPSFHRSRFLLSTREQNNQSFQFTTILSEVLVLLHFYYKYFLILVVELFPIKSRKRER